MVMKGRGIQVNFDLLENGIDSLRQAKMNIDENYLDHEFESFQLKDGLFNFIHGFEILAKYIIGSENEEKLITSKTLNIYREAKTSLNKSLKTVFEVDSNIRTISIWEVIKLLKSDFSLIDSELIKGLDYLIKKRNGLMHYTVDINEMEKEEFVEKLRNSIDSSIEYFQSNIPDFDQVYNKQERNYQYTEYDKYVDRAIDAAESSYEDGRMEHSIERHKED